MDSGTVTGLFTQAGLGSIRCLLAATLNIRQSEVWCGGQSETRKSSQAQDRSRRGGEGREGKEGISNAPAKSSSLSLAAAATSDFTHENRFIICPTSTVLDWHGDSGPERKSGPAKIS